MENDSSFMIPETSVFQNKTEPHSFIWATNFFCRFKKDLSHLAEPLNCWPRKYVQPELDYCLEEHGTSFEALKESLVKPSALPVLVANIYFILNTDSSSYHLVLNLLQQEDYSDTQK